MCVLISTHTHTRVYIRIQSNYWLRHTCCEALISPNPKWLIKIGFVLYFDKIKPCRPIIGFAAYAVEPNEASQGTEWRRICDSAYCTRRSCWFGISGHMLLRVSECTGKNNSIRSIPASVSTFVPLSAESFLYKSLVLFSRARIKSLRFSLACGYTYTRTHAHVRTHVLKTHTTGENRGYIERTRNGCGSRPSGQVFYFLPRSQISWLNDR